MTKRVPHREVLRKFISPHRDKTSKILSCYLTMFKEYETKFRWKEALCQKEGIPDLLENVILMRKELLKNQKVNLDSSYVEILRSRVLQAHVKLFRLVLERCFRVKKELNLENDDESLLYLEDLFYTMLILNGFSYHVCLLIFEDSGSISAKIQRDNEHVVYVVGNLKKQAVVSSEEKGRTIHFEEYFMKTISLEKLKMTFDLYDSLTTKEVSLPNSNDFRKAREAWKNYLSSYKGKLSKKLEESLSNLIAKSYANIPERNREPKGIFKEELIASYFSDIIKLSLRFVRESRVRVATVLELCVRGLVQGACQGFVLNLIASFSFCRKLHESLINNIELEKNLQAEENGVANQAETIAKMEKDGSKLGDGNVDDLSNGFLKYIHQNVMELCKDNKYAFDERLKNAVEEIFKYNLSDHYETIARNVLEKPQLELYLNLVSEYVPVLVFGHIINGAGKEEFLWLGNAFRLDNLKEKKLRFGTSAHVPYFNSFDEEREDYPMNIYVVVPNKTEYIKNIILKFQRMFREKERIGDVISRCTKMCEVLLVKVIHPNQDDVNGVDFVVLETETKVDLEKKLRITKLEEDVVMDGKYIVPCVFGQLTEEHMFQWLVLSPKLFLLLYASLNKHVEGDELKGELLISLGSKEVESVYETLYHDEKGVIKKVDKLWFAIQNMNLFEQYFKSFWPHLKSLVDGSYGRKVVLLSDRVFEKKYESTSQQKSDEMNKILSRLVCKDDEDTIHTCVERIAKSRTRWEVQKSVLEGKVSSAITSSGAVSGSLVLNLNGKFCGTHESQLKYFFVQGFISSQLKEVKQRIEGGFDVQTFSDVNIFYF